MNTEKIKAMINEYDNKIKEANKLNLLIQKELDKQNTELDKQNTELDKQDSENIHEIKRRIYRILDGNWGNENSGQLEIINQTQNLVVDTITTLLAVFIDKKIISQDEIKTFCEVGWRIDYN